MSKVFIVGVNHCWQQLPNLTIGRPSVEDPRSGLREITGGEFADFDAFLQSTIRQNGIRTIVEEACGSPHLRIRKLAEDLKLHHVFCELSKAEREKRGIKTIADRERHWLSVLTGVQHFPVLVVCGAFHVKSFGELLS
jgi:hypothetical protein